MASVAGQIHMALDAEVGAELTAKYWNSLRDTALDLMAKRKSVKTIAKALASEIRRRETKKQA